MDIQRPAENRKKLRQKNGERKRAKNAPRGTGWNYLSKFWYFLTGTSYAWGRDVNDQIVHLRSVPQGDEAMIQLTILRNILLSEPRYRQDLADVRVSLERIGDPIIELLRIETPSSNPAPRDDSLQFFKENQSTTLSTSSQKWISAVALGNNALPAVFYGGSDSIKTFRGEAGRLLTCAGMMLAVR